MLPALRFSTTRLIIFYIPIVCLSCFLFSQALRRRFWQERLDTHKQAFELESADTEVLTLEHLAPTGLRVMLFLPAWSAAKVFPYVETSEGRERDLSAIRSFNALRHPRRLQLTCGLQFDEDGRSYWWRGAWRALGEEELPVGKVKTGFRIEGMALGWRIAPDANSRLIPAGPQTRIFPLFVNRQGDSIGLEVRMTQPEKP